MPHFAVDELPLSRYTPSHSKGAVAERLKATVC